MKKILARYDILAIMVLFLAAIPAEHNEIFSLLEEQTLSARQLLRMNYGDPDEIAFSSDQIVMVNTDEDFFEEYGSWPLRRTDIAKLATRLDGMGARVIALDLLMDFPSSYGEDPETAELLAATEKTLLVSQAEIVNGEFQQMNYPTETLRGSARSGYTNISSSSSIITSLSRLKVREDATSVEDGWPFAVQALAMYYDAEPELVKEGEAVLLKIGDKVSVALDQFNQFYIDFPALPDGNQFLNQSEGVSALDILELDEDEWEDERYRYEDKIVLVGDVSEVSHDWFDTPVGMVYGIEIIADTIHTLMRGAPLQPASDRQEIAALMVVMLMMILLSFVTSPVGKFGLLLVIFGGYTVLVTRLYIGGGVVFSMSYLLVATTLSYLLVNLRHYLLERSQKRLVTDAFGHYLSPDVVEALVKDPSKMVLGGESREMTAFFSDVASFSTISEKLTPAELVALLNEYLTDMCNIIADTGGTIDKFEGDAIIAFWGAPLAMEDHAVQACYSVIDQQKALKLFRKRLIQERQLPVEFRVRMGVNTGPMIVGNMGSAQRMDYTMMGDSVNLAARLEGANKFYRNYSMISEATYAGAKDFIDARELDRIRVVGKNESVTVYDLLERRNQTSGPMAELVPIYLRGLELYRQMDFSAAQQQFRKALQVIEKDGPSLTYVDRCQHLIDKPPAADWDGVWTHARKG